jgi:hypothetical protein
MYDTITLITAVYEAYQYLHPEANHGGVEAWDGQLNAGDLSTGQVMAEYAKVCADCLVQVFDTGDERGISTIGLVAIGIAAGHYSASSELTEDLEEVRQIAARALAVASETSNTCDDVLTLLE